jgi:hypothetical protein
MILTHGMGFGGGLVAGGYGAGYVRTVVDVPTIKDLYGGNNHVPPVWLPDHNETPYNDDEEVLALFALAYMEVTRWEV